MKTYWKKIKAFWKELGNILTNVACPLLAIVAAILEVFGAPANWIQGVKKAEHWCWNASGTKDKIDEIVDAVDGVIEMLPDKEEEEVEDEEKIEVEEETQEEVGEE